MNRRLLAFVLSVMTISAVYSQDRKVENRPYVDLRPFHFGVLVGTHLQDIEMLNVGPQIIELEDGTTAEKLISCDQDRWDACFNVGVLGELRLSTHFQLRLAPTMYFGTRHLTFLNHTDATSDGKHLEEHQLLKTAYIATPINLIFAAPRFNNHRPYMMAGIDPMINLSGKDNDFIKLKRYDFFLELGVGCDFYLPFFKLRPELKFMYSLTNSLDTDHVKHMKNKNMIMYANSVSESRTKMIVLTFYFE
jgi:hypothetical protein